MPTTSPLFTAFAITLTVFFNCMMAVYLTIYPTSFLFMATAHS